MAQTVMNMAAMFQNLRIPWNAHPIKVTLPDPPELKGALTPNRWLTKAQRFANNRVIGPESMAVVDGYVYTGLSNGWLAEVSPVGRVRGIRRLSLRTCGPRNKREDACGRPLGLRVDSRGYLLVADAYSGIFQVNPGNGSLMWLVNARSERVNGKPLGFINDLVVRKDGVIFFTSSSAKWTRTQHLNIILEGEKSGRLLMYDPRAGRRNRVRLLLDDLSFPSGLELSKNEQYLLLGEGGRARIHRVWIGASSKHGSVEIFADNLPGFVNNIRRSPRDTFWVGLSSVRHNGLPSILDTYGNLPQQRRQIMGMPKDLVRARFSRYGLALELNKDGQIIRSLHDPNGTLFTAVTEIEEKNGTLYIGSFDRRFIGVLRLNSLPPPWPMDASGKVNKPGNTGDAFTSSGANVVGSKPNQSRPTDTKTNKNTNTNTNTNANTNANTNTNANANPSTDVKTNLERDRSPLGMLMSHITKSMDMMNGQTMRDMVLVLFKQLIEARQEATKTRERATRLKSDLSKLKQILNTGFMNTNLQAGRSEL